MKEEFLHYVWRFKKFDVLNICTTNFEPVQVVSVGEYLERSGPDFFNAQLFIGNQKWAGNVEIHLKSSDWYAHNHECDQAYENVILHVVWEHDMAIFRADNSEIPTVELKDFVSLEVVSNYQSLTIPKKWIYCEGQIANVDDFVLNSWMERLFFERLEQKSKLIDELLQETGNDWEAVLFCFLAKNFGLNTNGSAFLELAKSIPFSIIRKESFEVENLEALLFGSAQLLADEVDDVYYKDLQFRYFYLVHKYQLTDRLATPLQFFRLRPDNFPTIRLSQLVNLYHSFQNLFSKIIALKSPTESYELFQIGVSSYWETHYTFDKISSKKNKKLSKAFIDLVLINTVIPMQFSYGKAHDDVNSEKLLDFIKKIASEKNNVINKFVSLQLKVKDAFVSQSLLQLKNEYCNKNKCLSCAVGVELLKVKPKISK